MKLITYLKSKEWFPYLIITICWAFSILPSGINSNWFFLDDPTSVLAGTQFMKTWNSFAPNSFLGRYIPGYWYYRGMVFNLFGNSNPTPSYIIQALSVLLTLFLIYWIIKTLVKSKLAGLLGSFLFITGSGIAENAYTIGKQEPMMLFSLLVATAASIKLFREKKTTWKKIVYFLLITFFSLNAIWNKEPSMLILLLALGFVVGSMKLHKQRQAYFLPALAIVLGLILSRVPHLIFWPAVWNEPYTSYTLSRSLIMTNLNIYLQQNPDFAVLLALSILMIPMYIIEKLRHPSKDNEERLSNIILISLFAIASIYSLVLLIWRWPMGYYLYVPIGILAIVFSIVLFRINTTFKAISKPTLILIIVIICASRIVSVANNLYLGKAQYSYNYLYTTAIDEFQNQAPQNSRLLVENWDFYGEEPLQSKILLQTIRGRTDLTVEGIGDLVDKRVVSQEMLDLYNWKGKLDSETRKPKPGDYVLVFVSNFTTIWRLRDVMPYQRSGSALLDQGYQLELVSEQNIDYRLPFLEPGMTVGSLPIWKIRATFQGYKLYKVIKTP